MSEVNFQKNVNKQKRIPKRGEDNESVLKQYGLLKKMEKLQPKLWYLYKY